MFIAQIIINVLILGWLLLLNWHIGKLWRTLESTVCAIERIANFVKPEQAVKSDLSPEEFRKRVQEYNLRMYPNQNQTEENKS